MTAFLVVAFLSFAARGYGFCWYCCRDAQHVKGGTDEDQADPDMVARVAVVQMRRKVWVSAENDAANAKGAFMACPTNVTLSVWQQADAYAMECHEAWRASERRLMGATS